MTFQNKFIVATGLLFAFGLAAFAQGTAFTYQGRLNSGSAPAAGIYDLRFAVYDSLNAGTQQGGLLTNSATAVSNGLFTVTLDFGNQFPGANRWLEIGVRTNGSGAFTTLAPRQPLTPTPYAVTAANFSGTLAPSQLPATVVVNTGMATGLNSTALGIATTASGSYSTALGFFSTASGGASTALGNSTKASGSDSTALGIDTTASGDYSTAMGRLSSATNNEATAMGFSTLAGGFASSAMGENSIANGYVSTAMGSSTTASGVYATAMGYNTVASGSYSTALGRYTTAANDDATAMGLGSIASGWDTTAMGTYTVASGHYSMAAGFYSQATNQGDFVWADSTSTTPFASTANDQFLIRAAGGVGIGTANPQGSLHVYSANNPTVARIQSSGTPGFGRLEFVSNPQGDVNEWRPGYIQSTDNGGFTGGLAFYVNGTGGGSKFGSNEVMRVVNGAVGIGTNSPQATLDVNGSLRINRGTVFNRVQDGIFDAGTSPSATFKTVTNSFPIAFSTVPTVTATAVNQVGTDYPDTFAVTIRRVTTTNMVVNIVRLDSGNPWGQNLRVAYHAWE